MCTELRETTNVVQYFAGGTLGKQELTLSMTLIKDGISCIFGESDNKFISVKDRE
jgi:hypothetical protein